MDKIKIGKWSLEPWQVGAGVVVVILGGYAYLTRAQYEPVPVADAEEVNPPMQLGTTQGDSQDLTAVYNTISENNKEIAKAFDNLSQQFEGYQANTNSLIKKSDATLLSYQNQLVAQPTQQFNLNEYLIKGINTKYGIDVSNELNSGGSISYNKATNNTKVMNAMGGVTKIMTSTQQEYNNLSSEAKAKVDKFVQDNKVDAGIAIKYGLN